LNYMSVKHNTNETPVYLHLPYFILQMQCVEFHKWNYIRFETKTYDLK